MIHRTMRLALLLAMGALAACAYPTRNEVKTEESRQHQYSWASLAPDDMPDTLVIVTASGGGTRATALAMAVLGTLNRIELPSGKRLADEVDVISSVSGGSVTAAYFAMHGAAGLSDLEQNFVRQDGIEAMLLRGLNPFGLAALSTPSTERIDLLIDYLDDRLFHEATFGFLIEKKRRPYLILNAADMVEGIPFPFTQYTMDLLCSDLGKMKISTAVAASAAFPVAMSPVTLKNYAPCDAVAKPGWIEQAATTGWHTNPGRVALGRAAAAYADGSKKYIHLLDGGIADNLGVSEPYRLLTNSDVSPLFLNQIQTGKVKKIIFVMVNARSFAPSDLDTEQATPGMISMLSASIDSSIDRATFGMAGRLRQLLTEDLLDFARDAEAVGESELATNLRTVAMNSRFIAVDFDAIPDADCRRRFHSIPTSWTLSKPQIDAVLAMGEALMADHPDFPSVLQAVGGHTDGPLGHIGEACDLLPEHSD